jgi:hypothetical protein
MRVIRRGEQADIADEFVAGAVRDRELGPCAGPKSGAACICAMKSAASASAIGDQPW